MHEYVFLGLAVIGGWFASYLGSYMKRKGENLATHEDLDKLISQMEATTKATKAIEAKISNEVWDRQKQWELKRDALVAALQTLERANYALMDMATAFEFKINNEEEHKLNKLGKTQDWQNAMNSHDNARVAVRLFCSHESNDLLYAAGIAIRTNASKLFKNVISGYDQMGYEVQTHIKAAFSAARQELGIDID